MEVVVYNLVPFIKYNFNISQENVFMMEFMRMLIDREWIESDL